MNNERPRRAAFAERNFQSKNGQLTRDGQPVTENLHVIDQALTDFANEAYRLEIYHYPQAPTILLDLDYNELKERFSDTIITITVHKDGKACRFGLSLMVPESKPGKVYAVLSAVKRNTDVRRSVTGDFWLES